MRILLFLLFFSIVLQAQDMKSPATRLLDVKGRIHSIITDIPDGRYEFIVDNSETGSWIHQYEGEQLIRTLHYSGESIYHLYASSDDKLYISFDKTDRLTVVDLKTTIQEKEINQKYAVQYVNDKHIFALKAYADIAIDAQFYVKTGLIILDKWTYEQVPNGFLPATFIVDTGTNSLLLKEIENWGKSNERSKVYVLNTYSLTKSGPFINESGNVLESQLSISSDDNYVAFVNERTLIVYDIRTKHRAMHFNSATNFNQVEFISPDELITYENDQRGSYYVGYKNLTTTEREMYHVKDKTINRGEVILAGRKKMALLYSTATNTIQIVKL